MLTHLDIVDVLHNLILDSNFKAHSHNDSRALVFLISLKHLCFNMPTPFSAALWQGLNVSILFVRIPSCFSDIHCCCGWVFISIVLLLWTFRDTPYCSINSVSEIWASFLDVGPRKWKKLKPVSPWCDLTFENIVSAYNTHSKRCCHHWLCCSMKSKNSLFMLFIPSVLWI